MKNVALLSKDDKIVLFTQTAVKMKLNPSIVEKDGRDTGVNVHNNVKKVEITLIKM